MPRIQSLKGRNQCVIFTAVKRSLKTAAVALLVASSVALATLLTPHASALAGGVSVFPCYNCKLGFNWVDSDSASGALQVTKRCRANRKLVLYGTSVGNTSGVLSRLDRTSSSRQGRWELVWSGPRLLVIMLAPKVVRGKTTCEGASVTFRPDLL